MPGDSTPAAVDECPWLTLALSEVGTKEAPGPADNPLVVAYFRDAGRPEVHDDEVAWCAAAVGSWLKRTGHQLPPPAKALMARTYMTYGVACPPKRGAIGVWPRGTGWQGHVGLVVSVDGRGSVRVVGGNQGNAVSVVTMPIATALAFRWPVSVHVEAS